MDELRFKISVSKLPTVKLLRVTNVTKGFDFEVNADFRPSKEMLDAGGLLTIQNKIHNVIQNAMLLGVAFLCYKGYTKYVNVKCNF